MSKDSGTSGDFITNNGSSNRTVSGSISGSLQANEIVQASFDAGATWINATVSGGTTWTATDSSSHSTSWTIKARVFNTVTVLSSAVSTQAVTYIGSIGAPIVALTTDTTDGVIGDNADSISSSAALTISSPGSGVTRTFVVDGGSPSGTYTAPTLNGTHTVVVTDTDVAGNTASTSYTFVLDDVAPVVSSATVNGSTLVLSYTETGSGLSTITPDPTDFSVTAGSGNSPIGVNSVLVDTNNKTVTLTLDLALTSTDTNIKVSYSAGSNVIQDIAGNQAINLTNRSVTNQSPQQAPTLSVTTSNTTFVESGSATSLFSGASASTIESGQTLTRLDMTVSGVSNSSAEQLIVDGSTINLVNGSGTTATNSLAYTVSVSAGLASVSLTKVGGVDSATMASVVNSIQYQDITNDPTAGNRVITLTRIDDSGSNTSPNINTAALSIASTVTVVPVNNAPTLSTTGLNSPFGAQGSAVSVFTGTSISTVESGQTIQSVTFTVSGISDTSNEVVGVDGSTIAIGGASSGSTATHGLSYSVTYSAGTATISLSGGSLSVVDAQALINGITYRDTNTSPTAGPRVFTLTQIQDSGGVANGGVDTTSLSSTSTISVSSATPPAETLTISAMSNDSGISGDYITNDGSSGRTVTGTVSSGLQANEKVQASFDGGTTWHDASTSGTNWTVTDAGSHSANWMIAARVYNTSTHLASTVVTQAVTFDNVPPATPTVVLTSDTTDGVAGDNTDSKTRSAALTVSSLAAGVTRTYTVDSGSASGTYTAPTGQGSHTVVVTDTDVAGNTATASTTFTLDSVAPVLSTAAVNGSTLVLTYTEAGTGFSTVTPSATDFTVSVNGSGNAPSSVVVDATAKTVTLTLANAVHNTDTVLESYTPGINQIEDIVGNTAIALTGQAVTNNTPAPTSVLAWISHNDFVLGQNGTLLDSRPLITMQVANTVSDTGAVISLDPNAALSNISVLDPVSNGGSTDGTKPVSALRDPLQFNVSSSTVLVDTNPSRPGTQIQIVIDISHAGIPVGGFNGYMKFISQSTIDAYATANIPLINLDGKAVTQAGWYDFTQRVPGGDGAKFITTGGHITAIVITITDNAFGDSDPTVGHVYDPGVPVLYAPVSTSPSAGELNAARNQPDTYVAIPEQLNAEMITQDDEAIDLKDKDLDKEGFAGKAQFVKPSLSNTSLQGVVPLSIASPQPPEKATSPEAKTNSNSESSKNGVDQNGQTGLRNTLTPPDAVPSPSGQVNYHLPQGTFTGGHGAISLVATQKDGTPLPSWVKFDAASGKVNAVVPKNLQTPLDIKVQATDSKGDKAETTLKIKPLESRPQSFMGKPPLSAQIESIARLVA